MDAITNIISDLIPFGISDPACSVYLNNLDQSKVSKNNANSLKESSLPTKTKKDQKEYHKDDFHQNKD
jgi:hypothetical protein